MKRIPLLFLKGLPVIEIMVFLTVLVLMSRRQFLLGGGVFLLALAVFAVGGR